MNYFIYNTYKALNNQLGVLGKVQMAYSCTQHLIFWVHTSVCLHWCENAVYYCCAQYSGFFCVTRNPDSKSHLGMREPWEHRTLFHGPIIEAHPQLTAILQTSSLSEWQQGVVTTWQLGVLLHCADDQPLSIWMDGWNFINPEGN